MGIPAECTLTPLAAATTITAAMASARSAVISLPFPAGGADVLTATVCGLLFTPK